MSDEARLRQYLEKVTADLRKAKGQIGDLRQRAQEPIAIVGMACRYPGGVGSPQQLWELVEQGRDSISRFPDDRGWDLERLYHPDPDNPGTSYTREGGFLDEVGGFDPGFFGISPREAFAIDPQQRLLLEAAWEAVESAGIDPRSLRRSQTGVFAGVMSQDYGAAGVGLAPGMTTSVVSGRVSYSLGLEGPAITLDTACSSSLVAMHLAAKALREGECDLALAGGVSVLATPHAIVLFSRQRGLAPDGRCKSFAEAADGVGWSEGVGMLVLERLSEAQANGHPVLATIRGSAVNQDGASNGLTAPNGPSQERVIRQALANARLQPKDIDAVEAHGTGTTLGDPIEAGALLATYGQDRETPLRLGSIKSNIGHTQAAAGVAGVIKTVMAMREGLLPKTLHLDSPSSKVDWEAGQIELLSEPVPWQPNGHPRRAAVSSFGISGTNAHVILEEAPKAAEAEQDEGQGDQGGGEATTPLPGPIPLTLSAKTEPALREAASRLASHLRANPELDPTDLAYSLAATRSAFEQRAVVLGGDREELLGALASIADGTSSPNAVQATATPGSLAYLFTGQGSQRPGMGKALYATHPAYRDALDQICAEIDPHLDHPLKELLFCQPDSPEAELLDHTTYAQPAIFATEVALYRLLESQGLVADLLAGHSVGELAALHISGALSLKDAAKLICARGALMGALPQGGAMVAIEATEDQAGEYLQGKEQELAIAAINGPTSIVLSGTEQAIEAAQSHWQEQGHKTKRLTVSHAFHSPLVEPMLADFEAVVSKLDFGAPQIPIASALSGELLTAEQATDPTYWVSHVRQPVRFAAAIETLKEQGTSTYLELGADPRLIPMAAECLEGQGTEPALIATLREGRDEAEALAIAIATAHANGAKLDWAALFKGTGAKQAPLPTYPFQRKRYWLSAAQGASDPSANGQTQTSHPLLGARIDSPEGEGITLTGRISLSTHPWLADHAVADTVLLPGTAFVEMALRAGEESGARTLQELVLQAPLILPEAGAIQLQVSLSGPDDEGAREVQIHSRPEASAEQEEEGEEPEWTCHAQGLLSDEVPAEPEPLNEWPPQGAEPLDIADLYPHLADAGLQYGEAFQGLTAAWRDGETVYAEVSLAEAQASEAGGFGMHPALLDAALHAVVPILLDGTGEEGPMAPSSWSGVALHSVGPRELRVRFVPCEEGGGSLDLADHAGGPIGTIRSVEMAPLDLGQVRSAQNRRSLYRVEWAEAALPSPPTAESLRVAMLGEVAGPAKAPRYAELDALKVALADGAEAPEVVLVEARPAGENDEQDLLAAAHAVTQSTLELLKAWLEIESLAGSRLVLLTRGAISVAEGESPDLATAPLAGLLRSAHSEHPGRFALMDSDGADASLDALIGALAIGAEEPQLALREGLVLAPRLARVETAGEIEPAPLDPESTVLITGGTSGIGAHVARHLATAHGARHLLLVSRSGAAASGAETLTAELGELGCEATVASCDVADRDQLAELIASIPPQHPLGAVVHSAGVLADGVLESLDEARLERVMRPKVDAAWHLHELTAEMGLSQFVVFSSAAGILGGAAQANYAAANAFLDALAQHRRGQGLPAHSLAWGLWGQQEGAAEAGPESDGVTRVVEQIRARLGFAPMPPQQGLELFDAARESSEPLLVPVAFDGAALRAQAHGGTLPAVLRQLVRVPARREVESGMFAARVRGLPEPEREAFVVDLVRAEVATVLGHASAHEVEPERSFKELGFDSLAAVELRNRLTAMTGLTLPATLVFDYPTCAGLGEFLCAEALGSERAVAVVSSASSSEEPVAIVGMSCRYPGGVESPRELWQLVAAGRDAILPFPADRGWDLERLYDADPDSTGTAYVREGGFVAGAEDFDASFFGISPREALAMDPQQRLLLEASWEALEDAGLDPQALRGSKTGVFAGIGTSDYGLGLSGETGVDAYVGTGLSSSVASGRIAYTLGLEGPAISVDTACSSSLVALHLAVQGLRQGDCSLALAGGVTVMSTPNVFVFSSRQRAVAPNGRSKSFAEAADGAGFSEGVGFIVLERLSEAERNGHPVLAVVRGSAINQDGASNGLAAPSRTAQETVIRQALANARLEPGEIDAVEAHGTGTALGDPIEAGALLATYGGGRSAPLRLGSIKSNIGHTQSAAGVAGVIKMVMAMREGHLPKTLHVDRPSSMIDWSSGDIELLVEGVPWATNGRPRRAAVSSFGMSGTNAHVILEQAPAPVEDEQGSAGDGGPLGLAPLVLSAKSEAALRNGAARLAAHVEAAPELAPLDVGFSLATGRPAFEHRGVVLAADRKQMMSGLAALGRGEDDDAVVVGRAAPAGKTAFLFAGYGSQWDGMAAELLDGSAVFAAQIRACEEALEPYLEWSLEDALRGRPGAPALDRPEIVQPALFAVMVSLGEVWRAAGVEPSVLVGHSQGEISAAYLAGGLSLDDAARVAVLRNRALVKLVGHGAMASVALSAKELEARLEPWQGGVEIAALNGPTAAVVAGGPEPLAGFLAQCERDGVKARQVRGATAASHSVQVEALREEMLEALAPISPRSGEIPFHSTVTGELLDTAALDAEYWYRSARETVKLEPVVRALIAGGFRTLIEVSAHPVLAIGVQETVEAVEAATGGSRVAVVPTLRRGEGGLDRVGRSLAQAHVGGAKIDWDAFFDSTGASRVPLPTYAFERKRYWAQSRATASDPSAIGQASAEHPLLGAALSIAGEGGESMLLTGRLSVHAYPWLADHVVAGTVTLPAGAFVELALDAARRTGAGEVAELALEAPLVFSAGAAVAIQVAVSAADDRGQRRVAIHSRIDGDGEEEVWARHAVGTLAAAAPEPPVRLAAWPPAEAEPLAVDSLYDELADAGLECGPALQGLTAAWRDGEAIYVEASLASDRAPEAPRYGLHPALLEAALHGIALARGVPSPVELPSSFGVISLLRPGSAGLRAKISLGEGGEASLELYGPDGDPLARIGSVATRPLDPSLAGAAGPGSLYRLEWQPLPPVNGEADTEAELWRFEPGPDRGEPIAAASAAADDALAAIGAWIADEEKVGSRLALITGGAIAVGDGEEPDPAAAPIWGVARAAQAEHPGRFALIDVDGSEASAAAMPAALAASAAEPGIAIRNGELRVPRLVRVRPGPGEAPARPFDPERTVLVAGAAAGFGSQLTRHLVAAHGVRHLVNWDGSERERLAQLLAAIPEEHPLGAVIHVGEVPEQATIGAWNLHELTKGLDLSAFVCFSTAAGILGREERAGEAATGAFLDALAQRRRAGGLPAIALAWDGQEQIAPQRRIDLFDAALAFDEPLLAAVAFDRAALREQTEAGTLPPILRDVHRVPDRRPSRDGSLAERLRSLTEEEQEGALLELVRGTVAAVLGHAAATDVAPDAVFQELGFDSLSAMDLRNRLETASGLPVTILALVNNPTPIGVARHLRALLAAPEDGLPSAAAGVAGGRDTAFVTLLETARQNDTVGEFVGLLASAAGFRPSFEDPAQANGLPRAIRLSEGDAKPGLVMIPSAGPMSGPHEYVRFAKEIGPGRTVLAVPLPGFLAGEPLPASLAAVAEMQAEAIREAGLGDGLLLAGHSSGGWLAHALASHLEALGIRPAGVVLLDTYPPQDPHLQEMVPRVLQGLGGAEEAGAAVDDVRLTAMGGYWRLLSGWEPEEIEAPTLVARAGTPAWDAAEGDSEWQAWWELPHSTVDVPGNHFTMMNEYAKSTAQIVEEALPNFEKKHKHSGS